MIHEHNLSPDRVQTVAWGPDLTFPGYLSTGERDGVVAAGKTNRDMPILVRALARTGTAGLIYDLDNTVTEAPAEVRVVHSGDEGTDPAAPAQYLYAPVVDRLRDASVIAIPIRDPDRLTGLTELNDALALGKPVVMTRSPYTPIDVGSIGCGIVVEPKDDPSWTRAIATLAQDHALRRTMGQRARTFAEREWNYGRFRSALVDVIRDAVR
jgi:glycosyltransferase involved in cell wall biosynthesis